MMKFQKSFQLKCKILVAMQRHDASSLLTPDGLYTYSTPLAAQIFKKKSFEEILSYALFKP